MAAAALAACLALQAACRLHTTNLVGTPTHQISHIVAHWALAVGQASKDVRTQTGHAAKAATGPKDLHHASATQFAAAAGFW